MRAIPFQLPYAETHYRFKLPWAPLHKPWPEIFIDAPHLCVPGECPPIFLCVKDADYFPIRILALELSIQGPDGTRAYSLPPIQRIDTQFHFSRLPVETLWAPGKYRLNARFELECGGKRRTVFNSSLPGLQVPSLEIEVLASPLPYPPGWLAGELHCHSWYSSDPVEYGASPKALQAAARALGLGYVLITDHSYDFYYEKDRYMRPCPPERKFSDYQKEISALNEELPGGPLLIAGEEVSCANSRGENVHLLVMGHDSFLPGLGDGGRRWFRNRPDWSIAQVLEAIGDTPCFAAHPKAQIGALERWIFRRGQWRAEDCRPGNSRGIQGLQFWNGHHGRDYSLGRAFWVQQLLQGERLLPIAANDAHGDLNYNTGVKLPLVSLYQSRNHVFGRARTLVRASPTLDSVRNGFCSGDVVCTDGPFPSLHSENGRLKVRGISIAEFGPISKVHLFEGRLGEPRERVAQSWVPAAGCLEFDESFSMDPSALYYRVEIRTQSGRLAMSSAKYSEDAQ